MIDVKRSQPAPSSLASKNLRGPDVLEALFRDFLGKCYLCELRFLGKGSFEVDHRWPAGDGGPEFDWENLFPICDGCNKRRKKRWPAGGLLDPAGNHGVERRIAQTMGLDEKAERVPTFQSMAADDPAAGNTAAELDHIHNDPRSFKAADLRDAIRRRLEKVEKEILEYLLARINAPADQHRIREHEQRIRKLVGRDAPFTMLVRSAIRENVPPDLLD